MSTSCVRGPSSSSALPPVISALEEGDLRPDQVSLIAKRLSVSERDVVEMNRRLAGDFSLNGKVREEDAGEWQDRLVDEGSDQEAQLAESEEVENRRRALVKALAVLDRRERRIFEARRLHDNPITLEDLAVECGISRERVRQIECRAFQKIQRVVRFATSRTQLSFSPYRSSGAAVASMRSEGA
jgi:RNA polymerase sigma-32 factor